MTRQKAMVKVLQKYGNKFSIKQIMYIKSALKWYGEDDIIDDEWEDHVANIIEMYTAVYRH